MKGIKGLSRENIRVVGCSVCLYLSAQGNVIAERQRNNIIKQSDYKKCYSPITNSVYRNERKSHPIAENPGILRVKISEQSIDIGTWEQIFYFEFDGKRDKRVLIKIIGE